MALIYSTHIYSILSYCIYRVYLRIYFQLGCTYCAPWETDPDTDCLHCRLTAWFRGQLSRLRKNSKCNSVTGSDRKHTDHSGNSVRHYCTVHLTDSRRRATVLLHPWDRYTAWESRDTARQEERIIKDTHIWCRAFICSRTGESDKLMTALMHHKTANWERHRETKKDRKLQLGSGEQYILD